MKKQKLSRVILLLIGVVVIGTIGGWLYFDHYVKNSYVPNNLPSYDFNINEGETVSGVIDRLDKEGFIPNVLALKLYLRINPGVISSVQAGNYRIAPGLGMLEVLQGFKNGQFPVRLIFIEGWRREEYATYLASQIGQEFAQQFYELTSEREGYLFPDTYFIDSKSSPEELLEKITENYQQKIQAINATEGFGASGLTSAEAITLASIVEREVINMVDRTLVADILLRRYKNDWPIEADATVQYVKASKRANEIGTWSAILTADFKWWPQDITVDDLAYDSPFNTRLNLGLPPAPISNPGLSAIEAVARPLENPYWFYLTDRNGVTRYAQTLEEHNSNIANFGLLQ
jgi:UPF0755 protein